MPNAVAVKQFSCDTVVPGCDAVFTGHSEREVLFEAVEHGRQVHGLSENVLQVALQVLDNIVDVPA